MKELLKRMWVEGRIPETRVLAAIAVAVTKEIITQEEADAILEHPRHSSDKTQHQS